MHFLEFRCVTGSFSCYLHIV